jgi:hypothetical protein
MRLEVWLEQAVEFPGETAGVGFKKCSRPTHFAMNRMYLEISTKASKGTRLSTCACRTMCYDTDNQPGLNDHTGAPNETDKH